MTAFPGISSRTRRLDWIDEKDQPITPEMTFADAAQMWIDSRMLRSASGGWAEGYIRPKTVDSYGQYIRSLNLFFAETRLCDIRLDHLARYQRRRIEGAEPFIRYRRPHDAKERIVNGVVVPPKGKTPCPAKPQKVNQELKLLIGILRRAKLWTEEQSRIYEPLIEEIPEIPRALSAEQQRRWLDVARSNPRWNVVHWYCLVAFDTCMGTNEMRSLRFGDINLQQGIVTVPVEGAKNFHRHRSIPIASPEAMWALEQLVKRAQELGSRDPQHYLFPFRPRGKRTDDQKEYDPARPMTVTGLKVRWDEIRQASGLLWFRPYDTRHTAITRLAEGGIPFNMIMKRAGHVSPKMTDHYTHISDQRQLRSVRMAQRNSGVREYPSGLEWNNFSQPYTPQYPAPVVPTPHVQPPVSSGTPNEVIGQLLRALQQYGVTPEQMREALLPASAAPSM